MGAPNSKSDICNLALDYLIRSNEEIIIDIAAPSTSTEQILARHYDKVRRSVLEQHPWKFATKRAVLTASNDTPEFGYTRAYNLPNDFIRVNTVSTSAYNFYPLYEDDYAIENNQILTGGGATESLYLRYVYDFTVVAKMTPLFIDLFSVELAHSVCGKFDGAKSTRDTINNDKEFLKARARSVNGQQGLMRKVDRSKSLSRRRGYGTPTLPSETKWYN